MFPVIITLQKLSNHLALLIPNSSDALEKQERDLGILQTLVPDRWKELYDHRESLFNLINPDFCGKASTSLNSSYHINHYSVAGFKEATQILA